MKKTIIFICLFFCIAGVFAASLLHDPLARAFMVLVCLAGIAALYFADRSREKQQAIENQRMEERRKEELIRDAGAAGFVLKVRCPSGIWIGLFFFLVGGLVLWQAAHDIRPVLVGMVSLLMGILFILIAVPRIGRPVLELSSFGIATPEYGRIPWSYVDGIDLIENRYRGKILSHTLIFHVPGLARYLNQFGAFRAFLFPLRSQVAKKQVRVLLRKADEHPNVILELSKELLKRATGRDCKWSAHLSEEDNDAYRHVQDSLKLTGDLMQRAGKTTENKDFRAMEHLAKMMETEQRWIDCELKVVNSAVDAKQRKQRCLTIAIVALILAYVGWRFWKTFSG